ncbi:NAD(P)/FAD-dependent oxidoreductase [Salsipaludibacter albus]|uniref:NAD(P)/FAD-dependent oxidoreductase n=1 Tax=Salsipaludibacter albus TaxID=2849650 RepID=UPI001EE3C886|nr:NAD(P)/FAD-dependent oxidoreductase [Salsipaludibacter albus]MBY5161237.1 NAD(P)/FAD-dependent oxidoreductase [Salsipaludibacter albus]
MTRSPIDAAPGSPPHVVVVGGGFGGLALGVALRRAVSRGELAVTLVDRHNHHTFQPLLYQVATSGLQPQDIGRPLRPILGRRKRMWRREAGPGITVRLGEVTDVDRDARQLHLDDGSRLDYDRLVVAAGAITSDFDLPGVAEHGFGLKTIPDALALRDHVLRCFEEAGAHPSRVDDGLLTFVVAGGGPTGVEVAGALSELVDHVLRRDHPELDVDRARIVLLEPTERLLGAFDPSSSERARAGLEAKGVDVRLGRGLARAHPDRVELDDGTSLATATLVWVAGVAPSPLAGRLTDDLDRGRVPVDAHLRMPDDPAVFVIGDMAGAHDDDGQLLPQLAPVAMQQGRHVADELLAELCGEDDPGAFSYTDKGIMATIGRNRAVAELPGGIRFGGWPAWIAWLGLHLAFLVGFRNRTAVAASWVHNYLTYDRAARLILHGDAPGLDHERLGGDHRLGRDRLDGPGD